MKRTRNEKIAIAFVVAAVVVATAIAVGVFVEMGRSNVAPPKVPDAPRLLHVAHMEIVEE